MGIYPGKRYTHTTLVLKYRKHNKVLQLVVSGVGDQVVTTKP